MQWLSPKQAGNLLGITPTTVRRWTEAGKLECRRINDRGDRRISMESIQGVLSGRRKSNPAARREAIYARVSGRGDQLSSLDAQEKELRSHVRGELIICIREVGSGLNEKRRGLKRLIKAAKQGRIDIVSVTHQDRLTRFGRETLEALLNSYGVELRILHETPTDQQAELLQDFMSILACFSGRLYGQRSAEAKRRLLEEARQKPEATHA